MKYCEAKTGDDERWAHFNTVHTPTGLSHHTTTAGTYLCENQPEPELGQSDVVRAPINQLPDDVLCYIFTLHCREKTNTVHLPFNRSDVSPQIAISHVCSVWRDIILNIPSLWNEFEVFMDYANDGDMLMEIVHDWLFRAGSLPCSLTLDFKADDNTLGTLREESWYSSIVKCLISPFRFRKLSTPWSSTHWGQFLQLPAEKLSCVEDLHICCINPPSISNFGVSTSQVLDGFKKLTKLTSLRLDRSRRKAFPHIVYSEDPMFAHIPWHQLRHIHLSIPISVLHCFTILQGSSMVLETCSFTVSDCYGPWAEIQSESLYCPQLRELGLEACLHPDRSYSQPILDPILLRIRMPNLKALAVGSSNRTYQRIVSFSTLVMMQNVSNTQLEEFLFNQYTRMDVGNLLTTFPSLKRVEVLAHTLLDNNSISQLGSGLIGPCLEKLIIMCHYIDLGKLLQMVKVRSSIGKLVNRDKWQAEKEPTSFRYVKLYRWETVAPEHEEIIEEINRCDVHLIVQRFGT